MVLSSNSDHLNLTEYHEWQIKLTRTAELNFIIKTVASVWLHRFRAQKSRRCVQRVVYLWSVFHGGILLRISSSNFDLTWF